MQKKAINFEEVYDVFAIRVIIDTPLESEKQIAGKLIPL